MLENIFKTQVSKKSPEEEIKELQAQVDILSAAALNPGNGDNSNNYNESAVEALKKAQARLEELQHEIKK